MSNPSDDIPDEVKHFTRNEALKNLLSGALAREMMKALIFLGGAGSTIPQDKVLQITSAIIGLLAFLVERRLSKVATRKTIIKTVDATLQATDGIVSVKPAVSIPVVVPVLKDPEI